MCETTDMSITEAFSKIISSSSSPAFENQVREKDSLNIQMVVAYKIVQEAGA